MERKRWAIFFVTREDPSSVPPQAQKEHFLVIPSGSVSKIGRNDPPFEADTCISRALIEVELDSDNTAKIKRVGKSPTTHVTSTQVRKQLAENAGVTLSVGEIIQFRSNSPGGDYLLKLAEITSDETRLPAFNNPKKPDSIFINLLDETDDIQPPIKSSPPLRTVKLAIMGSRGKKKDSATVPATPISSQDQTVDSLDAHPSPLRLPHGALQLDMPGSEHFAKPKKRLNALESSSEIRRDPPSRSPPSPRQSLWDLKKEPAVPLPRSDSVYSVSTDPDFAVKMSSLKALVPNRSDETLRSALQAMKGSLNAAADFLLEHVGAADKMLQKRFDIINIQRQVKEAMRTNYESSLAKPVADRPPTPYFGASNSLQRAVSILEDDSDDDVESDSLEGRSVAKKVNFDIDPQTNSTLDNFKDEWSSLRATMNGKVPTGVLSFVERILARNETLQAQIARVTGGYAFEVWEKVESFRKSRPNSFSSTGVSGDIKKEEETEYECTICLESKQLVSGGQCGCKTMCIDCYPGMYEKNLECPKCLKPLRTSAESNRSLSGASITIETMYSRVDIHPPHQQQAAGLAFQSPAPNRSNFDSPEPVGRFQGSSFAVPAPAPVAAAPAPHPVAPLVPAPASRPLAKAVAKEENSSPEDQGIASRLRSHGPKQPLRKRKRV